MATGRIIYTTGSTALRVVFLKADDGTYLLTSGGSAGSFEAYNSGHESLYQATVTETGKAGIYSYTIPTVTSLPVDLEVLVFDTDIAGIDGLIAVDAMSLNPAGVRTTFNNAFDAILIESGITGSSSLVNDAASQLTSLNARQAMALWTAALAGVLSGATGTSVTIKAGGKTTSRIVATVDADGNRSALTLTVPT